MPRKQRLAPVANLARHQQLLAEKALADARRQVNSRKEMLSQLRSFRAQYDQGEYRTQVGARSVAALRDFESFLRRLDLAIEQQQSDLAMTEQTAGELLTALKAATTRAESLQLVLERSRTLARRRDEARDQQLLDELAAMAPRRR